MKQIFAFVILATLLLAPSLLAQKPTRVKPKKDQGMTKINTNLKLKDPSYPASYYRLANNPHPVVKLIGYKSSGPHSALPESERIIPSHETGSPPECHRNSPRGTDLPTAPSRSRWSGPPQVSPHPSRRASSGHG